MNTSDIEILIEKFLEGDTTLLEEEVLRDFFMGEGVPPALEPYRDLFAYYGRERKIELGDRNFDQKVSTLLRGDEGERQVIPMFAGRRRFLLLSAIAASVLLLVALLFTLQSDVLNNSSKMADISDPELLYAEASNALILVSGNLNNGLRHLEKLQTVDKAMKELALFNKFYQYQTIIINPDEILHPSIKSK